jgi:type I restriction enzyme R subunit
VYSAQDVRGALVSLKDELPRLDDRHRRVLAVFQERGIAAVTPETVDDCVELLRDVRLRADFIVKLRQFLESLDTVLPRPVALPYVRDARLLGFIGKAAANRYRDSGLTLAGAGHKVRHLIDQHIAAHGVDPTVLPISIMDPGFEAAVKALPSDRARASEMEHAARHYISVRYREDPAYYRKLSERLEEVLQDFQDNWAALVVYLLALTRDIQAGRPANVMGLTEEQAPFFGILAEEAAPGGHLSEEQQRHLAAQTVALVEQIRQAIGTVDFWRNTYAQDRLRLQITEFLDDHDLVPLDRQQPVADRLVELARALHARLVR